MPGVRAPASLRQRALMWLAQRDHSRKELHDKLQRWVQGLEAARALAPTAPWPDAQQIPALLSELEAAGHLSDARVVESRIHVREPARAALRASELQRAHSVWARKFGQAPANAAERARHMRFLAGRGFTADTIRAVLRGAPADDEPELDT